MSAGTTSEASLDEYLGADKAGLEYFTRGGQIYAAPSIQTDPEQAGVACPRGRFSAYNRLRRRHPNTLAP